ncbi:MAG: hypothetical protein ABI566_10670 [Pseudolysinimonas sp.]
MRAGVALAALALALAGCTPVPRAASEHFVVPQDLVWRYVSHCTQDAGEAGPFVFSFGDGPATIQFETPTPENEVVAAEAAACLDRYRYDTASSFQYVSAFERAQLFDYYSGQTRPCLAANGVDVPPIARDQFFVPDERPWNPYTSIEGYSFDRLLELYDACPPVPRYLLARHEF